MYNNNDEVKNFSFQGAGLPSTSLSTKDASVDDSGSKKKRLAAEKEQNQNFNELATDAASQVRSNYEFFSPCFKSFQSTGKIRVFNWPNAILYRFIYVHE